MTERFDRRVLDTCHFTVVSDTQRLPTSPPGNKAPMLAGCLCVSSEADGAPGGDGAAGGSGMFSAACRGSQAAYRPNDPVLARDLDLVAALRVAGRSLPGPDDDARARMRAHLMSEIGGPVRLEGRQDRGAPHASSTGSPSADEL
jgi:hypothetical protein